MANAQLTRPLRWGLVALTSTLFLLTSAPSALAQVPAFTLSAERATLGPGSETSLIFTLNNSGGGPLMGAAFTANLPAGVTLAPFANAQTDCVNASLLAPSGGSTIDFSEARMGAGTTCTVVAAIRATAVGTAIITSGDLTSSAGNSGPASTTVTVAATLAGLSLGFSPSVIAPGQVSTMTFVLDNSLNPGQIPNVSLQVALPTGMSFSTPDNATTDCQFASLNPDPVVNALFFTMPVALGAGASCSASVDITTIGPGAFGTTTSDVRDQFGASISGRASALLDASVRPFQKLFTNDPVLRGGTVTLEYTISNLNRGSAATDIAFTDDLNAALPGLAAIGLPLNDVCGPGSQLAGTTQAALTGGNLAPEASCTFSIDVQVPTTAASGSYLSTTDIAATVGGQNANWNQASDTLVVASGLQITEQFLPDPVAAGSNVTLEYTITNSDPASAATDIAFNNTLSDFVPGMTVVSSPGAGVCGAGSNLFVQPGGQFNPLTIDLSGGNLPAAGACTFSLELAIPLGVAGGTYTERTGPVTATMNGATISSPVSSASAVVVSAPALSKSFTDDPVAPGGTVTVEYTLFYGENAPADATNISFVDELSAAVPGLEAIGLPLPDVCGVGSQISGTSTLTLTGGSLSANDSCSFSVQLTAPSTTLPGTYVSTTSTVGATSLGLDVFELPGSDVLDVLGLGIAKSFVDDPALAGATVDLEFTISNNHASIAATAVQFTDDLNAVLPGLTAVGLPLPDVCGAGSVVSGTNLISLVGGDLAPGTACTFVVPVSIPVLAQPGEYLNTTSAVTADYGGTFVTSRTAVDRLNVVDPLSIAKSFADDPAMPGDSVTLEFTLTNNNPDQTATLITFTDVLDLEIPLMAQGLPLDDVCGPGSQLSGTNVLTFTGGTLGAAASCTFSVMVQIPTDLIAGTQVINVTGPVSGEIDGVGVTGAPAVDELVIDFFQFTKSFTSSVTPGGTTSVIFNIADAGTSSGASTLSFVDDLEAALPGLTATGLPMMQVCGPDSELAGTSNISLRNGAVARAGVCSFEVSLEVPMSATAGTYDSTTSVLSALGARVATPATATLIVAAPPVPMFGKTFSPEMISQGEPSTLTFNIDNSASTADATALNFTDSFPANLIVADAPMASTTCGGGTLAAAAGANVVALSDAVVAAGASCAVQVNVTTTEPGTYVNSTELTSSAGSSGMASATLTVQQGPGVDSGVVDSGHADGGIADTGTGPDDGDGGCGCQTKEPGGSPLSALLLLVMAVGLVVRRAA